MKILIIGGTQFIGRAFTGDLLNRDHDITLFHRGKTNLDILPNVARIFGDRETDLENLGDQKWDVVIDICGYYPKHVQLSVDYLKDKTEYYVYISSVSAYKPTTEIGIDETAELQDDSDDSNEVVWWKGDYGRNKVLCEEIVLNGFGTEKSLIIRPGAVIGPYDNNNFFTYWVVRIRLGGNIIAPGDGAKPLQFIDARDLASFTNDMIEQKMSDIFTVTGPVEPILFSSFLNTLINHFDTDANLHWINDRWLLDHNIVQDWEIPYWLPQPEGKAYFHLSIDKALNKGLKFRPLHETITDVANWYDEHVSGHTEDWVDGLPPDFLGLKTSKEIELLDEFLRDRN
ncbi:MAG: NAD-dependent epimerase/dehydratase family protein [Candidatus Kariarchaeaceae archaeon]|jgi:2'-hydroxyisoflavone reductase